MKIIDLLNKIANGEDIPKKIRVSGAWTEGIAFELDDYKHYKHENIDDTYDDLFDDLDDFLNTEIIEEDKKIEKIKWKSNVEHLKQVDTNTNEVIDKINEIIDYLNKGDK